MKFKLCVVALLLASGDARAATPLELYRQGKYDAAISAGTAQGDAQGFAVAARAELAAEAMRDTPCLACIHRAQDDAQKSIAADPKLPEAHIFLAAALGYESRVIGMIAAGTRGFAWKGKTQIDEALALDADNPWALAAHGSWNIEVVRIGGKTLAHWIYGASVEAGLTDFKAAFSAAPENPALRYQYALSLSGYDPQAYRSDIDAALTKTQTLKAMTAYEAFVQGRAKELQDALKKGDEDLFARLVRRDQGYPP
jgi:hypothetical protein